MPTAHLVCNECGHEETIRLLSDQEKADPRIPKAAPRCPKCGSVNVALHR